MLTLKHPLFLIALLFTLAGYSQANQTEVIVEGKVIAEATGKPVSNVHVFIPGSEEETLTNSNGEFRIKSWQKAPFKLTVKNYGNYKDETVTVSNPSQKIVVRLKSKK